MIDFSDISIISHVKIDNPDRLENFKIRNDFYRKYCSNLEMIHIEDDTVRKCNKGVEDGDIHILTLNKGLYNKNDSYNRALTTTDRKYLLFLDVDCILDPTVIKTMAEKFADNAVVYPYKGVLYSTKHFASGFAKNPDLKNLMGLNDPKKGRIFMDSCGGAILMSRDMFIKTGGFNPYFSGWGYEDTEYRDRCLKMETRIVRPKENVNMLHLYHGDHAFSRSNHARSKATLNNKRELDKVRAMSKVQCVKHMKTWGIYED